MGMQLSSQTLIDLMKRFDSDSDGTISLEEFKAMMEELQRHKKEGRNFWSGIGKQLKRVVSKKGVTRKLEIAFEMRHIDRVEKLADNRKLAKKYVARELAPLALAIYFKGLDDPMVVMCSKPGHVDAWVEALRITTTWALENVDWGADEVAKDGRAAAMERGGIRNSWRCSTIDWGLDDDDVPNLNQYKDDNLKCVSNTIDWG